MTGRSSLTSHVRMDRNTESEMDALLSEMSHFARAYGSKLRWRDSADIIRAHFARAYGSKPSSLEFHRGLCLVSLRTCVWIETAPVNTKSVGLTGRTSYVRTDRNIGVILRRQVRTTSRFARAHGSKPNENLGDLLGWLGALCTCAWSETAMTRPRRLPGGAPCMCARDRNRTK
jgi:hypothetical protein